MTLQRSSPPALAFAVVILAAGASTRMGRPKLLLPWGGTSVIGHLLAQWQQLGAAQIAVVRSPKDPVLAAELDRLGFPESHRIVNPEPERGMFSSLQCAARWPAWPGNFTHWVVALGDQPHLRPETLRALVDCGAAHPAAICQPAFAGRPKHPVWLPKAHFFRLRESLEENLREYLQLHRTDLYYCDLADAGLAIDLDRPADYEKAAQLYLNRA